MTYMPFAKPVLVPDLKAAVTKDTFPNALTSAADTLGEVVDWTNLEAPKSWSGKASASAASRMSSFRSVTESHITRLRAAATAMTTYIDTIATLRTDRDALFERRSALTDGLSLLTSAISREKLGAASDPFATSPLLQAPPAPPWMGDTVPAENQAYSNWLNTEITSFNKDVETWEGDVKLAKETASAALTANGVPMGPRLPLGDPEFPSDGYQPPADPTDDSTGDGELIPDEPVIDPPSPDGNTGGGSTGGGGGGSSTGAGGGGSTGGGGGSSSGSETVQPVIPDIPDPSTVPDPVAPSAGSSGAGSSGAGTGTGSGSLSGSHSPIGSNAPLTDTSPDGNLPGAHDPLGQPSPPLVDVPTDPALVESLFAEAIAEDWLPEDAATMTSEELHDWLLVHPEDAIALTDNAPELDAPGPEGELAALVAQAPETPALDPELANLPDGVRPAPIAPDATLAAAHVAKVEAYFATLTPQQASALAVPHPTEIGKLEGAPLELRANARQISIIAEVAQLQTNSPLVNGAPPLAPGEQGNVVSRQDYLASRLS